MSICKILVASVFTLTASVALAATPPADCRAALMTAAEQASDAMPANGAYAGQMVENVKGRTLKLLSLQEKLAFGIDPSLLAFANFRYQNQFYIAHISGIKVDQDNKPISANATLDSVSVISEHWEALTNPALAPFESHSYLRFKFKDGEGVHLDFNQSLNSPATEAPIANVILSTEALRPQNDLNADFMPHAFVFDFAIGHLFYAQADRDQSESLDVGKVRDVLRLNFANSKSRIAGIDDPSMAILFRAIQSSEQFGRTQAYNFVVNNCTNRMIDVLDDSVSSTGGFDKTAFITSVTTAMTGDIPPALAYLKAVVAAKGTSLPPSMLTELNKLSPDQVMPVLIEGAVKSQNPAEYNTWFPPFVVAHLIGRGLLP